MTLSGTDPEILGDQHPGKPGNSQPYVGFDWLFSLGLDGGCSMIAKYQILCVLIFALKPLPQPDGLIIEKIRIHNLDQLAAYIQTTEAGRTPVLDQTRFTHFKDVKVFGLTYLSDQLKVKGFLLLPAEPGIYPSIIYNRGGSREWGSLTHGVASVGLGELAEIAREGYVIAASQYRGNGGSEGMEEYGGRDIYDVLNLFKVLEQVPEADTTNMGMFGWSRGGAQTFNTMKHTDRLKAVAVGGPGSDLISVGNKRPYLVDNWGTLIPGFHEDPEKALRDRSAVYWAEQLPCEVPILILHGNNDRKATPDDSLRLALAFHKNKIPYRLVMFENGSHSLREHHEEAFRQVIAWFDRFLKQGEKLPG